MSTPVLHLIAGPNGAGKSTFYDQVVSVTGLPFVNADSIARENWPDDPAPHAYDAAALAEARRGELIAERASFVAETVFSHPSKVELLEAAVAAGYRTCLHVILIPEELAVVRVELRVEAGGHDVPEDKIRSRYRRLWSLVRQGIERAGEAHVYDNSRAASPFRRVAAYEHGRLLATPDWPVWTPRDLL